MNVEPQPRPETVEAVHEIAWRVAELKTARTDGLDRKAATLATFASLLTSLTATLGLPFVEVVSSLWAVPLFVGALALLGGSVSMAVRALSPKEYVGLGMEYVDRLPTWSVVLGPPEAVRGETARGVIKSVRQERRTNDLKARQIRRAFHLLLAGLLLSSLEAATLAVREALR